MITQEKIIYSINVEDIQNVAIDTVDRQLSDEELEKVESVIGDYIDWYEAVNYSIQKILKMEVDGIQGGPGETK